jgi:hypothetical protein
MPGWSSRMEGRWSCFIRPHLLQFIMYLLIRTTAGQLDPEKIWRRPSAHSAASPMPALPNGGDSVRSQGKLSPAQLRGGGEGGGEIRFATRRCRSLTPQPVPWSVDPARLYLSVLPRIPI